MKPGNKTYLDIAKTIADCSYAARSKVGALIVKDGNIMSFGYNGTPSGFDNACEEDIRNVNSDEPNAMINVTKQIVIHAEANAICKLAKAGARSAEGATMYVTHSPCIECAKLIIQCGISRVIFAEAYRLDDGIRLLRQAGIHCELGQSEV